LSLPLPAPEDVVCPFSIRFSSDILSASAVNRYYCGL
jgi:hypothetical protein